MDVLRILNEWQLTSISPVFSRGLTIPSGRFSTSTLYGDDELITQRFCLAVRLGVVLGVENDLGYTEAISEIDENDTPVIATSRHPPHEGHLLSKEIGRQRAAVVRSLPRAQTFDDVTHIPHC